jgi:arylsulfatase A-like enzyme
VRAGDWKLIEFCEEGKLELYDLREDPGERNDLSAKRPEKRDELLGLLRAWQAEVGARPALPR